MKRLAVMSLFCGILALNPGTAQDPKAPPAAPSQNPWAKVRPGATAPEPARRAVYTVVNGDAAALAAVVGAHFKGEATLIAAPGNALLISGSAAAEVLKLLEQLDKKARTVEVEVTIAEVLAKDWKDGDVKLEDLLKDAAGKAATGQRIKLTALEGQQVSAQSGGSRPFVDGGQRVNQGGGLKGGPLGGQRSITYREVGTTVKMTARVGTGDAVAVELSVQASRVRTVEAADDVTAAAVETGSLATKLSVPAGKSVVAQAVRMDGKDGATISVVVVTARVVPNIPPILNK